MVRTEVQLPDELYRELEALAKDKEWSLAEALRRAAEQLLQSYPRRRSPKAEWKLPGPFSMGEFLMPVDEWRAMAAEREPPPSGKP
jgi:Arc/MetJ-type ribon-helix-helix transcriptional regulator